MVYFFHHYEIPAIIQQGTVHNITATVNIHEHQVAPERRPDQAHRHSSTQPDREERRSSTTDTAAGVDRGEGAVGGDITASLSVQETGEVLTDTDMVSSV